MKRFLAVTLSLILCLVTLVAFAATKGEQNALASALNYLSFMNFSYKGLYGQLEYDGYSASECQYGVENCGADWYDQAAGSAKNYMSFMSFSKKGLIEQLEYDGYTKAQAEYGAAVAYDENPVKPDKAGLTVSIPTSSLLSDDPTPTATPVVEVETEVWESGKKINMSALSYDELIEIQKAATAEIMSRPEWKEVEVPAGVWIIGQDIPAGFYSITPKSYVTFKYYESVDTDYWNYYSLSGGEGLGKYELKEGMKIDINGTVILAPPKGLGF